MDELKKHAKERARPFRQKLSEAAQIGAEEYLAEQGLDYSLDTTDITKDQYVECFNEEIRDIL